MLILKLYGVITFALVPVTVCKTNFPFNNQYKHSLNDVIMGKIIYNLSAAALRYFTMLAWFQTLEGISSINPENHSIVDKVI